MEKIFVLDTNVLMNDSNAIYSFKTNTVILPLTVLEELDNNKTRFDDAGKNTRESVRKIIEYRKKGDLFKGVILENGGKLFVYANKQFSKSSKEKNKISVPTDLQQDKNDNEILLTCLQLKEQHEELKSVSVILVTNDLLLQVKADSLGIECEEYKKLNMAESVGSLYSGIKEISITDLDSSFIDSFYKDQKNTLVPQQIIENEILNPNQFLVVKDQNEKSMTARFVAVDKPLKPIDMKKQIWSIKPKNKEQAFALDLLMDPKVELVTVTGKSGTGKNTIALAAGLQQVLETKKYKKLIVIRPVHSVGKELGFLPGNAMEKLEPWIEPIKDTLRFLLSEDTSMIEEKGGVVATHFNKKKKKQNAEIDDGILGEYFEKGIIEIEALSFIRGRSIQNAFIILDEFQNCSLHEVKTVLTRAGEGTKIVMIGDIEQLDRTDLSSVSNGLSIVIEKFKTIELAGHVTLSKGERSALATKASEIL